MENIPVEVIGNILSHIRSARNNVVASSTCKKWRQAWRSHFHTLSFNSCDWPVYHDFTSDTLEILITQTIFQTKALRCLIISMSDVHEFSTVPVIAWLMYTRDTLCELHFHVSAPPMFNITEKCSRQKLEGLALGRNSITRVDPSYQKFPCLKSLSLSFVSILELDLCLLVTACPGLETLSMVSPEISMSDSQASMEISSSLKEFSVESFGLDKFVIEADLLECLHLKDCTFEVFELIGKGSMKVLKVDDVRVIHLDIGDNADSLEFVDISNFTIMWPKFYHMISKASKLRRLRLWGVVFEDDDEVVDLQTISVFFPQLMFLSLSYDLRDGVLNYGLQGSSLLTNVSVLELGWTSINDLFAVWVAGLLERCPNLKKMVIHGFVSEVKTHEECIILAKFTDFIIQLGREYTDVKIEFEYE
ncbi:F-box/LRR-repeat protein At1g67190-like [Vicia villosa]|uniref:F-box/LRR-repeat protein At1g67190-like n=1 Tax=Vicia villosa TaxID=3911 RepID=UPI00273C2E12|nr:F-box/LRR-repeat protein At1g67190-like [Vicia villosa]